jgi:hypothetical protein
MEVVIFLLIVVAILSYVYQTLPSTKFQKANALFDSGNIYDAVIILENIFESHPDAPAKLAECKLLQGRRTNDTNIALNYYREVVEIKTKLPLSANKINYEKANAKAQYETALIKFNTANALTNATSKFKNLKDNLLYIDSACQSGIENDYSLLKKKHLKELSIISFSFGLQNEKANNFKEAIHHYNIAKEFASKTSKATNILNDSTVRIAISRLKNNEKFDIDYLENTNGSLEYKRDFYYRYVIKLLSEDDFIKSEQIINNYLNFPSPVIEKLKVYLRDKIKTFAVNRVKEINNQLDKLYENSFPIDEVKTLYDTLDQSLKYIKPILPSVIDTINELKLGLFKRLLNHYIAEQLYDNSIALIQNYPTFWDRPELLKYLALSCINFVEQGKISEKNYKNIISCWLSAVFCDRVILYSIEETSWDDEYTFTLAEAIGSNYEFYSELPPNVNYDSPDNVNISIGAIQKELLLQFETLLNSSISDNALLLDATNFYDEEKTAIEKIVEIIDTEMFFPSPYLAKAIGINKVIVEALNSDYVDYKNEAALHCGFAYLTRVQSDPVSRYYTAKNIVSKILKAISDENLKVIKDIISDKNKIIIEEFETIKLSFADSVYNAFEIKIKQNDENEGIIPLMAECMNLTNQNDKLKFQYSNYIANLCIVKVNANEFSNFQALNLMKSAYLNSKDNSKISKNIVTLIRRNLSDYLNGTCGNVNEMFAIIEIIRQNRSHTFLSCTDELSQELELINDSLITNGSSINQLVSKLPTELTPAGIKLLRMITVLKQLIRAT